MSQRPRETFLCPTPFPFLSKPSDAKAATENALPGSLCAPFEQVRLSDTRQTLSALLPAGMPPPSLALTAS